jgi:hypothetical protein
MEDLVKALSIMLKRGDVRNPTHCVHDELHVYPNDMIFSAEDIIELEALGFFPNDMDGFVSFRFGSC